VIIGREINVSRNTVTLIFRTETDAKHSWALGVAGAVSSPPTVTQTPGVGDTGAPAITGIAHPPQRLTFRYDSPGVASSGEFSRDLTFTLYDTTGAAISTAVTWTYEVISGTVNGFTSASGPQSMSGTGTGTLPVSSLGSSEAKVKVSAVYDSKTYLSTETLTQQVATGAVSGGSGSSEIASNSISNSFNSTSFASRGSVNSTMPAGVTAPNINVYVDVEPAAGGTGTWTSSAGCRAAAC
jgi:hypothetical protein